MKSVYLKDYSVKTFAYHCLYLGIIIHFLTVFFLLTSCSKDDSGAPVDEFIDSPVDEIPVLPEISLESGSETLFLGVVGGSSESLLNHSVKIEAPEGLKSLKISRVRDGDVEEYSTIADGHPEFTEGMTSYTYELDYILGEDDVEKELYFLAEGVDELGNTTSLKFAEAWVKLPMLSSSFSLQASKTMSFNSQLNYYLVVKGNSIKAVKRSEASLDENDEDVVAILSYNNDAEFYLASPKDVSEPELTDALLEISNTKFKYDILAEDELMNTFNVLDVHNIESKYDELLFSENEERLEKLKSGYRFYIQTEDNRTAILQIKKIESLEPVYTLIAFDILITQ